MLTGTLATRGSSLTGVLSGAGTEMVHAIVHTAPPPTLPPRELRSVARPMYDRDGTLVDWKLAADRSCTDHDVLALSRWRQGFVSERFLGEVALVAALLDWADRRCSAPVLSALRERHARLDVADALRARDQIRMVGDRCAREPRGGLGVFAPAGSATPMRGFVVTQPITVLAVPGVAITADERGLHLADRVSSWPDRVPDDGDVATIAGWSIEGDRVQVVRADGLIEPSVPSVMEMLRFVGRGRSEVGIRAVPLTTLVAPLVVFLSDMANLAAACHASLTIRRGPQ